MVEGYPEVRDERLIPLFEEPQSWFEGIRWEMPNGLFGTVHFLTPDAVCFRGRTDFRTAAETQRVYERHCRAIDLKTPQGEEPLPVKVVETRSEAKGLDETAMWTRPFGSATDYRDVDDIDGSRVLNDDIYVSCRVPFVGTVTTLPKLWLELRRVFDGESPIDIERIARETETVMKDAL